MQPTPPGRRAAEDMTARVSALTIEGSTTLGIGSARPRLSWVIESSDPLWRPTRQRLELARAGHPPVFADIPGDESVLVDWPFPPLASRDLVHVRVAVGDRAGWTDPSPWVRIEAGLLEQGDWTADWITPVGIGGLDDGAPLLFRDAEIEGEIERARLYATAQGVYELSIDGRRVSDAYFTPGWTAYQRRLRYQTYDVTSLVRGVRSIRLGALLGNGWFRGQLVWSGKRDSYGATLSVRAQLELVYRDGSRRIIGTDESWRAAPSCITFDDFYDGESQDRRVPGTSQLDPAECRPVRALGPVPVVLDGPDGPPVRCTEVVRAVEISRTARGSFLVDFGQNLVGFVRLRVGGSRGDEVTIRHAEVLENGELALRPLRSAKATARYLLAGDGEETLEPRFTFMGFRFAEVTGITTLAADQIEAVVLGSDLERRGWLHTSDPALNRLHANVVWSARGNLLEIPTDCPQRDERLGWTGDIQVFAPTASFLFDMSGMLGGWLRDLALEQRPDGAVPEIVPDVLRTEETGFAGWGDAAVVVPMVLWWSYRDVEVLRRQYDSMRAWVEFVRRRAPHGIWGTGFQFGDWLDPAAPPEQAHAARADPAVVATAYFARSAGLLAEASAVLGRTDDAEEYAALRDRVATAFADAFVSPGGRILSDCQTVYSLAIAFDLIADPVARRGAEERLAALVVAEDHRIGTGFLGTPVVLEALTLAGRSDLAARMLRQREAPSWLYAVDMGATTIWERWDSMLPDGSINTGEMTSFNHYAYGCVAEWMHARLAGLRALEAGYRRVRVEPMTTAGLTEVSARHVSPYGPIAVRWSHRPDGFHLQVEIPHGVTAEVVAPGEEPVVVGPGAHRFRTDDAPDGLARPHAEARTVSRA